MKIALTLETNMDGKRNGWVNDLSVGLESHFADKNYGDDLKELIIGIIAVAPEYDFLFKIRKPKYRQGKKVLNTYGTEYELEDNVVYDVKLDFLLYSRYKKDEFITNLKSVILSSVQILKQIKKLKKFDIEAFESELSDFLKLGTIE